MRLWSAKRRHGSFMQNMQQRSSQSLEICGGIRSILKKEIRTKRTHEINLPDKIKENQKRFYVY